MAQKKLLFNNTYDEGSVRTFIYKQKDADVFTAVTLEFGLVIEAKTLKAAHECIKDVTENYYRNVIENKLSEELLNRPAPKEYWALYGRYLTLEIEKIDREIKARSPQTPLPPYNLSNQGYQGGIFCYA